MDLLVLMAPQAHTGSLVHRAHTDPLGRTVIQARMEHPDPMVPQDPTGLQVHTVPLAHMVLQVLTALAHMDHLDPMACQGNRPLQVAMAAALTVSLQTSNDLFGSTASSLGATKSFGN